MTRSMLLGLALLVCCGCSTSTEGVATTAVSFNVEGAPTVEFNVPDMMCPDSCVAKTKEILSQQPGAKEVLVNFDTKTATVAVEADKFNADDAVAAMKDHSFNHTTVKQPTDQPASENHGG
jgi:copper chaperone CopZ